MVFSHKGCVLCCCRKSQKQRNHKQLEQQAKRQQPAFYLRVSECHCKSAQKGCQWKTRNPCGIVCFYSDAYSYISLYHVFLLQEVSKPPTTEAPGSWRTSLRKAGSSVTLGSAGLSDSSQDSSRPAESVLGMSRSASSPRLSSEADTKVQLDARYDISLKQKSQMPSVCSQEPRLARVPPIPTRRLFSIPDSNPDNRWALQRFAPHRGDSSLCICAFCVSQLVKS